MPQDKDFKRLVRARMRATGEKYTQARAVLAPMVLAGVETKPAQWLRELGDRAVARAAYERLQALPPSELIATVLPGLALENWRVRKHACALLDDVEFTDASFAGLTACLSDPVPDVRRAAMHTLSCQHCKPDGCFVDVRGVFERMKDDPSSDVRKNVLGPLGWWEQRHEDWSIELIRYFAANDRSEKLRRAATRDLEQVEEWRASDERRRSLPEHLRTKTERHPGKWVFIQDGRIVGVDLTRKRRLHFPRVESYYVWPTRIGQDDLIAHVRLESRQGTVAHSVSKLTAGSDQS
jgi:hypothetical protein